MATTPYTLATVEYVNAADDLKLNTAGGTISGTLSVLGDAAFSNTQTSFNGLAIFATNASFSGNITQSGAKSLTTGTAAVTLNGDTTVAGGKKLTVNTSSTVNQTSINNSTGQCLRLIYNNSLGTETNYADLNVSSGGDLVFEPSSHVLIASSNNKAAVSARNRTTATLRCDLGYDTTYDGGWICAHNSGIAYKPLLLQPQSTTVGVKIGSSNGSISKELEVNHATGQCLRLIYNDSANRADFSVSSGGQLTIAPSGGTTHMTNSVKVGSTVAPTKQLEVNHATGQCLRLIYNDTGNTTDFAVSSAGKLSVTASGGETTINDTTIIKSNSSKPLSIRNATNDLLRLDLGYDSVDFNAAVINAHHSGVVWRPIHLNPNATEGVKIKATNPFNPPTKSLEINDATGQCLRLIYNDDPDLYVDMGISATGDLNITPASSQTFLTGTLYPQFMGFTGVGSNLIWRTVIKEASFTAAASPHTVSFTEALLNTQTGHDLILSIIGTHTTASGAGADIHTIGDSSTTSLKAVWNAGASRTDVTFTYTGSAFNTGKMKIVLIVQG